MNLAFGTILVFLIVVPGIVFRLSYFHGEFSKRFIKTSPFDDFIWALIPGILVQLSAACLVNSLACIPQKVDFVSLGFLFLGSKDDVHVMTAFNDIETNLFYIILYNVTLCILTGVSGYCCRKLIRQYKLDVRFRFLRFNNEWYYIFKGEILEFPENDLKPQTIDVIWIDALTKTGSEMIIYIGKLQAFYLSKDGGLESILVENPKRRMMNEKNDSPATPEKEKYYSIPSNFIVLKNEHILNLNIRYVDALEIGKETEPPQSQQPFYTITSPHA